jgi:hypothetical protein
MRQVVARLWTRAIRNIPHMESVIQNVAASVGELVPGDWREVSWNGG